MKLSTETLMEEVQSVVLGEDELESKKGTTRIHKFWNSQLTKCSLRA